MPRRPASHRARAPRLTLCAAGLALALLAAGPVGAQTAPTGEAALAAAAAEPGAVRTPSGMVFRSLKDGTGAQPAATDTVRVNYRGTLPDGREFDSSYKRGQPASFALNRVIPCWTEGVQKMKVGGKAKLVCPPALAYGDRGAGRDVPPGATLIFEVELLDVMPAR
jgi:FKBP-type peptidyl-prolyl cis-trans isomerase FkpA